MDLSVDSHMARMKLFSKKKIYVKKEDVMASGTKVAAPMVGDVSLGIKKLIGKI